MAEGLFRGIVPAVVTPFRSDERIDYRVWQELIEALIASRVDGLLFLGGPGEFHALAEEEREVAARFAAQTVDGRLPVYVNIGSTSTQQSIRLAQQAETDGVDCLVAVTPYCVEPSEAELIDHYADICRSVQTPVLACNIPPFTHVMLTPAILGQVATVSENFAGLNDSSGNLDAIGGYTAAGLHVLVGRDNLALEGLKRGCEGVASPAANIVPLAFADLYAAFRAGDLARAERLQSLIQPLEDAFNLCTFPAIVKEALTLIGMSAGPCRRPVGQVSAESRETLSGILENLRSEGYLLSAPARAAGR